jgi:hypothetical protein
MWRTQRPAADNHYNGLFMEAACNLAESHQEINLSAPITRD